MSETKKQAVMYEDRCRKAEREWNELKVRYEDMERKSQRQLQEMKSQCASDKEDLEAELRDLRRDFEFTSSSLHDTQEALDAVRRELTIAREELMRASHERVFLSFFLYSPFCIFLSLSSSEELFSSIR